MSTHKNCYDIVGDVREALNEYSPAYVQGNDTSGTYNNRYLIRKINEALSHIYTILMKRPDISQEFLGEADLVGVNSVYTLPADFGKLIEFRNPEGIKIDPIIQTERRFVDGAGNQLQYYRTGNTLVIDFNGLNTTCKLFYYKKPKEIHLGVFSAGDTNTVTLDKTAKKIADYYNDVVIEDVTDEEFYTITDYTTARVATIVGTGVAGNYYGTVPDVPEVFHKFIALLATYETKSELSVAQEKPSVKELTIIGESINAAIAAYSGNEDIPAEEFFMDDEILL